MKKTILFASLLAILISCSQETKKQTCSISWKLENGDLIGKDIIVEEIMSGKIIASDTILVKDKSFSSDIKFDSACVRMVYIMNREFKPFEIALEESSVTVKIDKEGKAKVSGSPLNETLQKFADEEEKFTEIIETVKKERNDKIDAHALTKEDGEKYTEKFKTLIDGNVDRTIAFVKENINNPIGKYYFYKTYFMLSSDKKQEMMSFATEDIKQSYK